MSRPLKAATSPSGGPRATGSPLTGPCWAVGTLGPGSAGASTLAVAVATHIDGVLIEADSDGGVLAARYGAWLNEQAPSLASLLAVLDTDSRTEGIEALLQRLPGGARTVLVPPDAEGAVGPVRRLGEDLPRVRQHLGREAVVLDIGRVRPDSVSLSLAEQADGLVVVVTPHVESLGCLLARLAPLGQAVQRMVIAVRGDGPYSLGEIHAAIQIRSERVIPVFAVPHDPRGVESLRKPAALDVKPARNRSRSLRTATAQLAEFLAAQPRLTPAEMDARRDVVAVKAVPLILRTDSGRRQRRAQ